MALYGHVSDTHFDVTGRLSRDSETGLDLDLLKRQAALAWCCRDAREHEVDALWHTGDLFGHADPAHSATVRRAALEAFAELGGGIPIFVLTGNHDLAKNPSEANATDLVGPDLVTVFDGPEVFEWNGVDFAVFPYPNKQMLLAECPHLGVLQAEQFMAAATMEILRGLAVQRRPGVPLILAAHIPLAFAHLTSEREMDPFSPDWKISPFDIAGLFDKILLGHFHRPQWPAENICYSGSPMELCFSDEDDDPDAQGRGYFLHDLSAGTSEFRVYPGGIRHLTVDLRGGNEWPSAEEAEGKIVRVLAGADADPRVLQEMVMGFGALSCRVDHQGRPSERRERAVEAGLTAEQYLRLYVAEKHPGEDVEGVVAEARRIQEAQV